MPSVCVAVCGLCLLLVLSPAQDMPLADADPVIWYSFGVTHAPRVEDFPIMPVEVVGFALKPDGFFAGALRGACVGVWVHTCRMRCMHACKQRE